MAKRTKATDNDGVIEIEEDADIAVVRKTVEKPKRLRVPRTWISTGSTLLNLACTGHIDRGLPTGCAHLFVGDPQAGKTWIAHTLLAEAAADKAYAGHRLIFDDVENGALMDIERFFGAKLVKRLEPPRKNKAGEPMYSVTVEEFYDNVDDATAAGKPFVFVEDSQDALTTEAELKKAKKDKATRRKERKGGKDGDEDMKGSYGTEKARVHSTRLRQAYARIRRTPSMLVILAQTRDNIGFGAQFNPKTRSGGKALKFYAGMELWFSVYGKIRRPVLGKPRELGVLAKVEIKKNRERGASRTVVFPIYASYGIDDIGGCIYYLLDEGVWKGSWNEGKVVAPEFDFDGKIENLAVHIGAEGLVEDLRQLVQARWNSVEAACVIDRQPRYF
jgi:RecA/RadA recombinase